MTPTPCTGVDGDQAALIEEARRWVAEGSSTFAGKQFVTGWASVIERLITALSTTPTAASVAGDRLVTITIGIGRNGDIFEDTQHHGNPWSDVYRGIHAVRDEVERLIGARRECPINPAVAGTADPEAASAQFAAAPPSPTIPDQEGLVEAIADALVTAERAEHGLPPCPFDTLREQDQATYLNRAKIAARTALSRMEEGRG